MFIAPNIASIMNASPPERRGVASGMSSTLINAGFLLSLGIAFVIMATSVPVGILQEIFSGNSVSIGVIELNSFVSSLHEVFLLMAFVSLIASVPAYLAKKRSPKIDLTGGSGEE